MSVRENQNRWIAALKSGDYKQTRGVLHDYSDCCCAMGVALRALGFDAQQSPFFEYFHYDGHSSIAPDRLIEALALRSATGGLLDNPEGYESIAEMNDEVELTLPQIGAWIEANREKVFTTCS